MERCVKELGFRGALVNGFSQLGDGDESVYYDLPQYRPFWATVERLDVPFYLHPRNPLPRDGKIYEGHPWLLGPIWAFGHETAVHALRLDGLRPVRRTSAAEHHPWPSRREPAVRHVAHRQRQWVDREPPQLSGEETRCAIISAANFHVTTSGNFHTQALIDAMLVLGADRIMFSADWPFENIDHAAHWFDACPISEPDRLKIGRTNARKLFKLGGD